MEVLERLSPSRRERSPDNHRSWALHPLSVLLLSSMWAAATTPGEQTAALRAATLARTAVLATVRSRQEGKTVAPMSVMWDVLEVSDESAKVTLRLTDEERGMLVSGLNEWGGPANGTQSLAVAMGFSSLEDLDAGDGQRIVEDISSGRALSVRDWTRALVATEIAFSSAVFGAADEWGPLHDGSDTYWMGVLRDLQHKVPYDSRFLEP